MTRVFVDRDNVNDESVIVRKLYKASGDRIDAGTLVLEYETSKTAVESESPVAGVLSLAVQSGDEVVIGGLLYEVAEAVAEPAAQPEGPPPVNPPPAPSMPAPAPALAVPASRPPPQLSKKAQALAAQLGVDLDTAAHSGWMTSADVRSLAGGAAPVPSPAPALAAANGLHPPRADSARLPEEVVSTPSVPYKTHRTAIRKRTEARALVRANSPGSTSTIGMSVRIRGERLVRPPPLFLDSISDIVIFEAARLLRSYPELNGVYLDEKNVGYYDEVNVGVSFDSGANLKVFALRGADLRTLTRIQAEFGELLDLYESDRPVPMEILSCATVTISDLSGSRASFMHPLLNERQSLIIGITRAPDGFTLFASFDHRVSEGLRVSKFLEELGARTASHFSEHAAAARLRCGACDKSMEQELALGHRGLISIALPNGSAGLLCRSCFEGL